MRERLKNLIATQCGADPSSITDNTPLMGEQLGFDSLDMILLAMDIEDEFGVVIDDDRIEHWKTFGALVRGVEALL